MNQDTKIIIGIIAATVVIITGGVIFLNKTSQTKPSKPVDQTYLIRGDSYKSSTPSATSTLVEFADYQCPACGAFHPILSTVLSEQKSRLNFVYRNYPLPQHTNAKPAAYAAEAAGKQEKYWEMYTMLYEKQKDWESEKDPKSKFMSYATSLKLDIPKFEKDMESSEIKDKVERDVRDGNALGVDSTPTFFLDGVQMQNLTTFESFKKSVEDILNQKK